MPPEMVKERKKERKIESETETDSEREKSVGKEGIIMPMAEIVERAGERNRGGA